MTTATRRMTPSRCPCSEVRPAACQQLRSRTRGRRGVRDAAFALAAFTTCVRCVSWCLSGYLWECSGLTRCVPRATYPRLACMCDSLRLSRCVTFQHNRTSACAVVCEKWRLCRRLAFSLWVCCSFRGWPAWPRVQRLLPLAWCLLTPRALVEVALCTVARLASGRAAYGDAQYSYVCGWGDVGEMNESI